MVDRRRKEYRRGYRSDEPRPESQTAPSKPGNRDGELFDMLRGFRENWSVIEGKGGPGSAYALKHQLYAYMHELAQSAV